MQGRSRKNGLSRQPGLLAGQQGGVVLSAGTTASFSRLVHQERLGGKVSKAGGVLAVYEANCIQYMRLDCTVQSLGRVLPSAQ